MAPTVDLMSETLWVVVLLWRWRCWLLKYNPALFHGRRVFDRLHFALESGDFRSGGAVAAREEEGWPENDQANRNDRSVLASFLVLNARRLSRSPRNVSGF